MESEILSLSIQSAIDLPNNTVEGQKILEIFKVNKTERIKSSDLESVRILVDEFNKLN